MISSLSSIAASRANGALSRGPKSPETLRVSAGNSLRHGLTARTVLLTNESQDRFQESLDAYLIRLQPRDQVEADLVEEIVVAKWRQRRLWGIEAASLNLEMARQDPDLNTRCIRVEEPTRQAVAFKTLADESNSLHLLNRYETRLIQTCERALLNLRFLRMMPVEPNEPSPIIDQDICVNSR